MRNTATKNLNDIVFMLVQEMYKPDYLEMTQNRLDIDEKLVNIICELSDFVDELVEL